MVRELGGRELGGSWKGSIGIALRRVRLPGYFAAWAENAKPLGHWVQRLLSPAQTEGGLIGCWEQDWLKVHPTLPMKLSAWHEGLLFCTV